MNKNEVSAPSFMGGSGYFNVTPIGASVAFFAANKQGSDKNKYPYYEDEDVERAKQKAEFICKSVNEYDKLKEDNAALLDVLKRVKDVLALHSGAKVFSDSFELEIKEAIQKAERQ